MIRIIRASADTPQAREELIARFAFSDRQAQAILDMRLRALTSLERDRVMNELTELRATIADLKDLLASDARVLEVVIEEVEEIAEKPVAARERRVTWRCGVIHLPNVL